MAIDPTTGLEEVPKAPEITQPTGILNAPANQGVATAGVQPPTLATAPATTPAAPVEPAKWDVNEKQTVAGQVADIIAKNSPLMQQAETAGQQQAAQRGLLNSSMAVGAAQDSVYRAATPIAMQDASVNAAAAQFNAGAENRFKEMDKSQGFDLTKMDKQAAITLEQMSVQQMNDLSKLAKLQGYDLEKMTAAQVNDLAKINTDNQWKQIMSTADNDTKVLMTQMQAQSQEMVSNSKIGQSIMSDFVTQAAAIQNNKDLSGAKDPATGLSPKNIAFNNLVANTNNSLQVQMAITGVDIGELLTFGPSEEEIAAAAATQKITDINNAATFTAPDGLMWKDKAAYDAHVASLPQPAFNY